ncbi:MAG: LegC family aminotransferase [Gammaproteobacteria bacterium]|nr:LegC family aminotransferase [Gammaproteobacteria bacterium]MBU1556143.1 LegC family aminotransferase [Gammaproteobacteria bacterium]MBU2069585.1 LegC family aminotransferase [Gammaproteobacteria bacterium]MBU2184450.1 LegC family aminotransferase [Gammaproteobacteria bacterium]MBU2205753.1 LegC family aminotransferase [Gammaproteobacteria bacterium]
MNAKIIHFVRQLYQTNAAIPLHAPRFVGNEQRYLADTITSTFVSSVGKYVDQFEQQIEHFTGCSKAVATVNGTAALHSALYMAGVQAGDLVITQPLTFVATCNALYHMGAEPVFVDVSATTLSLCPQALLNFLQQQAATDAQGCYLKSNGQRIKAVMPMHTFGHPAALDELLQICQQWQLILVEDAAESLGSFYKGQHTGTLGHFGALSFNGNKIITTGGGGMLLCASATDGSRAKHLTTTAKVAHRWEFYHDEPGFNYRLPNLNAALGCAQMESLQYFLQQKRELAMQYKAFFAGSDYQFIDEPAQCSSNFWLNAVLCPDQQRRDDLLQHSNDAGVMTRPVWQLMHQLPAFKHAVRGPLQCAEELALRLINLPSSVPEAQ